MTHPPGNDTVAFLNRPNSGPMMQIEPRILRIKS